MRDLTAKLPKLTPPQLAMLERLYTHGKVSTHGAKWQTYDKLVTAGLVTTTCRPWGSARANVTADGETVLIGAVGDRMSALRKLKADVEMNRRLQAATEETAGRVNEARNAVARALFAANQVTKGATLPTRRSFNELLDAARDAFDTLSRAQSAHEAAYVAAMDAEKAATTTEN